MNDVVDAEPMISDLDEPKAQNAPTSMRRMAVAALVSAVFVLVGASGLFTKKIMPMADVSATVEYGAAIWGSKNQGVWQGSALANRLKNYLDQYENQEKILRAYHSGAAWEVWLQVELWVHFSFKADFLVMREEHYSAAALLQLKKAGIVKPGATAAWVDLVVDEDGGKKSLLEIKVQTMSTGKEDVLKMVKKDYDKIRTEINCCAYLLLVAQTDFIKYVHDHHKADWWFATVKFSERGSSKGTWGAILIEVK